MIECRYFYLFGNDKTAILLCSSVCGTDGLIVAIGATLIVYSLGDVANQRKDVLFRF